MNLLHIHQDYPDGRAYPNTKAVSNLIEETEYQKPEIKHYVLSINRTSNPLKISIKEFDQGISLVYWALPLPLIYKPVIYFWSFVISFYIKSKKINLIHGHKLTTEGLFSFYLSNRINSPYVISVRGGSDCRNIKRLPDCIGTFKQVFKNAKKVFWVSPWAKEFVESKLDYQHPNEQVLPNICKIELIEPEYTQVRKSYAIIISFHQFKRKGIFPLFEAIARLKNKGIFILLDVIGSGDKKYEQLIVEKIKALDISDQITLLGKVEHPTALSYLKKSKALLLPSINETFGMAYVEALACGCPVLYIKNTGIDGHLDEISPGVGIENQNVEVMEEAIIELENNYEQYKSSIVEATNANYLMKFTGEIVANSYIQEITNLD